VRRIAVAILFVAAGFVAGALLPFCSGRASGAMLGAAAHQSDSAMPRRAPRSFKQLPPIVQETLVAEGCTIPEAGFSSRVNSNVIQGTFAAPGQMDWAVLCAKGKRASIRVFWGGSAAPCPASLEEYDNENAMVLDGRDGPWYSRSLSTASPARIREAHGRYGQEAGVKLPSELTHDGIEDGIEKGSLILYCHDGKWLRLVGAD
jgi:hypothetical protein